jgi:hypothetical protein
MIASCVAMVTVGLNTIALVVTSRQSVVNTRAVLEQITMQREGVEQARPVDFKVDSRTLSGSGVQLRMQNLGVANIVDVVGQYEFIFAFPGGRMKSPRGVEELLRDSSALLRAARAANLLVRAEDVQQLLGESRDFQVASLTGTRAGGPPDIFEPEISQSSIDNAVRLAKVVNGKPVMRWRFEYQHAVSRQRFVSLVHVLLDPGSAPTMLQVRVTRVIELNRTLGGRALIDAINKYEVESMEEIFPERSGRRGGPGPKSF